MFGAANRRRREALASRKNYSGVQALDEANLAEQGGYY